MVLESTIQSRIARKIRDRLHGSCVMINDGNYIQGFPDITVYYKDKFAMLEVKRTRNSEHQPNQDYYIDKFREHVFAEFIYPENEEEILSAMERSLRS